MPPVAPSKTIVAKPAGRQGANTVTLSKKQVRTNQRVAQAAVRRANQLLGEELGRLGIGRLRLEPWLREPDGEWPRQLSGACHQMGTTRMAASPRDGVVDPDCRVHGVGNLYVAGSSVFPTAGCANPTLTLVALAARLADHLARAC